MADGNVFGLEINPKVDDSLYADDPVEETTDEPTEDAVEAEPQAPEAEAAPEAPVEDAAPPAEEAAPAPDAEVETPPVEEVVVPEFITSDRDLSKFKSVEALGEGYKNAILLHNRSAQRAREAEENANEWRRVAEQATQMLDARRAPAQPTGELPPDIAALAKEAGVDEDTLRVAQALVARQGQEQSSAMNQAQMEREMEQRRQQAAAQLQATVSDFFSRHPEVDQGGEMDNKLGEVVGYFRLDPSMPDSLEAAYELARDPELDKYVRANPHLIDTDEGIAQARDQLALNKRLELAASSHTAAQNEAARQAALTKASVETGSGTPPTSPGGENDEWAQVLAVARSDRGAEDVFGLGSPKK